MHYLETHAVNYSARDDDDDEDMVINPVASETGHEHEEEPPSFINLVSSTPDIVSDDNQNRANLEVIPTQRCLQFLDDEYPVYILADRQVPDESNIREDTQVEDTQDANIDIQELDTSTSSAANEQLFIKKVCEKIQADRNSRGAKSREAAAFLRECFNEYSKNDDLIRWLAKKLNSRPGRIKDILPYYPRI